MKKFLAALLVGAFGVSAIAQSSASAFDPTTDPSVVYDYKATFKRIDPQYKIRKVDSVKMITESYGIKSDSITGYILLPTCVSCEKGTLESSFSPDFSGFGYFVRKDDKLIRNAGIKFVTKTNVIATSGIFGKNAFVKDDGSNDAQEPSSLKNLKNAWMDLAFAVPTNENLSPTGYEGDLFIKGIVTDPSKLEDNIFVGFIGLDQYDRFPLTEQGLETSTVYNNGFGTVKLLTKDEATSLGLCGNPTTPGSSCWIIQSISGSMLGDFGYQGTCFVTPMWDLCDPTVGGAVGAAPIAGTWTLKFNKKLTEVAPANKESEILKKLKAESTDIVYTSDVAN